MQPRPLNVDQDLPALAALLGRTRAAGGIWHPGGIQWWLRELASGRDDFEAHVWPGEDGGLAAFAMRDGTYIVAETDGGPPHMELIEWATDHLREAGASEIQTIAVEGDEIHAALTARGFTPSSSGFELVIDTDSEPVQARLPDDFSFASLQDVSDDAFIEGHRAAWSDTKPSQYGHDRHDAVKRSPQFRPDLVTIALSADGTVASYCIGWLDTPTRTLEIEPLGTHRDYRRLGLAHAVVREVTHRAWANGAEHVLVWNEPARNLPAYGLYTGAGMAERRRLVDLTRVL